jgi:hypothetical protein
MKWKLFLLSLFCFLQADANSFSEVAQQNVRPMRLENVRMIWHNTLCEIRGERLWGQDPYTHQPVLRDFYHYKPNRVRSRPVIILPPFYGFDPIDHEMSLFLCFSGIPVYSLPRLEGPTYDLNLSRLDQQTVRSIFGLRELIETLAQPVDLMGASLGSLYGMVLSGLEKHVKKVILIAAGINLPGIMSDSALPNLVYQRDEWMMRKGRNNIDDYRNFLRRQLQCEPGDYLTGTHPAKNYLIFVSLWDIVIPTRYQMDLVDKLPGAKVMYIKGTHTFTIVSAYTRYRYEILRFILSR